MVKGPCLNNFFQTYRPFLICGKITFVSYYVVSTRPKKLEKPEIPIALKFSWKVVHIFSLSGQIIKHLT